MTPAKLNQIWWKRFRKLDNKKADGDQLSYEQDIEHALISQFLTDIEYLAVEESDEQRENRELISKVADQIRKDQVKITL